MLTFKFDQKIELTQRQIEGIRCALSGLNIGIESLKVLIKGIESGKTKSHIITGVHGLTGKIKETVVPEILDSIARELPEGHKEVTGYIYEGNEFHKLVLIPRKGLFWYTFPVNHIHWQGGEYTTVANE